MLLVHPVVGLMGATESSDYQDRNQHGSKERVMLWCIMSLFSELGDQARSYFCLQLLLGQLGGLDDVAAAPSC